MPRPGPILLALLAATSNALADSPDEKPPESLFDRRLAEIRTASVSWDVRLGPTRKVVDQVCLVPDVPTFLAAIGTWDREHWFPILIDDGELTWKFLRAFRPARVVRFPEAAPAIPPDRLWTEALAAVGRSWSSPGKDGGDPLPADQVPAQLGPTPPGVVISHPGASELAGAVALAAGRSQPLIRWESAKTREAILTTEEAGRLAFDLEARVIEAIPRHDALGDDCDFITLAGDYPYRAKLPAELSGGVGCFDDGVARAGKDRRRWAFTGRLIGGQAQGVYRAMCALFLRADSALLFNGYEEDSEPWSTYAMQGAARRLGSDLPTTLRTGADQADVAGWHRAFGPWNRHGLALINSHGSPTVFHLRRGPATTGDVPLTDPVALVMIHSFSAADPYDPATIAGRWLANGAFAFFGSVHEPFLQSFRTPGLVADLIGEGLPLGVAARQYRGEPFGFPWRLIYLGDPLYRPLPPGRPADRIPAEAKWPAYRVYKPPAADARDEVKFQWAVKAALALAGRPQAPAGVDLPGTLLAIRRDRLAPASRRIYDAFLVDVLMRQGRLDVVRGRLRAIPAGEADADTGRWLESACLADLHRSLAAGDFPAACDAWADLVGSGRMPGESREIVTRRLGAAADSPATRRIWRDRLARAAKSSPEDRAVGAELERVEALLHPAR